ncbi:hypothetical protein LTR17_019491, partial [Elasticomyces elasticus]
DLLEMSQAEQDNKFFAPVISNATAMREVLMPDVKFVSRFGDYRTTHGFGQTLTPTRRAGPFVLFGMPLSSFKSDSAAA